MKKKYLILYFSESFITFSILVLFLSTIFKSLYGDMLDLTSFIQMYTLMNCFIVLSISILITIICLLKKKNELDVNSLIFPISYLLFLIFIIIISFVLNRYVIVQYMHFVYYYRFIIFDYFLLSLYTLLSFKKLKRRNS